MDSLHYQQSNNNFDFIRFLAALFVIISHSFDIPGNGKNEPLRILLQTELSFSYVGLSAFFLISGFLITQSWAQKKSLRQYFQNRLLRIVPGLAVVVLLTILIYGPLFTDLPLSAYFADIETYTYLKNILIFQAQGQLPGVTSGAYRGPINGSIWTLPYEVLFYILVPVLSPIFLKTKLRAAASLSLIILIGYWMISHPAVAMMYSPKVNMYRGILFSFAGFFAVGAICYVYHQSIPFGKIYFCVFLILYLAIIRLFDISLVKLFSPIFLGYLIFCLAFWPSPLSRFGKSGDLSYGMYIYAFPIQLVVIYYFHIQNTWLSILTTLLFVMPLATLSWHFVEKPSLKLKRNSKQNPFTYQPTTNP